MGHYLIEVFLGVRLPILMNRTILDLSVFMTQVFFKIEDVQFHEVFVC